MRKLVLLVSALILAACAVVERKDPVPDRPITEPGSPETSVSGGGASSTQGGAPQGTNIGSEVSRSRQR
ncbi:MAG: hypothetical protein ACREV9_13490 [Burkholderiales bacterium]